MKIPINHPYFPTLFPHSSHLLLFVILITREPLVRNGVGRCRGTFSLPPPLDIKLSISEIINGNYGEIM
jgi:hypothetical protein